MSLFSRSLRSQSNPRPHQELPHRATQPPRRLTHHSYHGPDDDRLQTMATLQQSLSETSGHFLTLQKAHDALYLEHVHLQEQMDDAVELLKYLKEEKVGHEQKIDELQGEIDKMLEQRKDSVVSVTIENLTRDKMHLERDLEGAIREKHELQMEREGLLKQKDTWEKVKEAFELQTRQHLATGEKIGNLEKERDMLRGRLEEMEMEEKKRTTLMEKPIHTQENEIQSLHSKIDTLEEELVQKRDHLGSIAKELSEEKQEMQVYLDSLQQQLNQYKEEEETENHQHQQQLQSQPSSQSSMEKESEMQSLSLEKYTVENEALRYQIQNLETQLREHTETLAHKEEIYAQLEKDMQERLTKRLKLQLQQSEVAIEDRLRKEMEVEYKLQAMQQVIGQQQQTHSSKSKSFHGGVEEHISSSTASTVQKELEEHLRKQLEQVKEERERWLLEQEQFQQKVLLSQHQLDKIREGYRSKYEKEKNRVKVLEKALEDQQVLIDTLHIELDANKDQLIQLQQEMEAQEKATNKQSSKCQLEKERKEFMEKEQKYKSHIDELQKEREALRNITTEELNEMKDYCNELEEEKSALIKKCDATLEDYESTLQAMKQLNSENQEYLKKIEVLESASASFKEMNDKSNEQCRQFQDQVTKLRKSYDEAIEMNNTIVSDFTSKLKDASCQFELEQQKWLQEKEVLMQEVGALSETMSESMESLRSTIEAEKDTLIKELKAERNKMCSLQAEYECLQNERDDQVVAIQRLMTEIEQLHTSLANEKSESSKKHAELTEVICSKEKDLSELLHSLSASRQEAELLASKLASATTEKELAILEHSKHLAILDAEKKELEENTSRYKEETKVKETELLDRLHVLEENSLHMQLEIQSKTLDLSQLRDKMSASDEDKQQFEVKLLDRVKNLETEKMNLLSSLDQLKESSKILLSNIQSLEEENRDLKLTLSDLMEENTAAEKEKDQLISEQSQRLRDLEVSMEKLVLLEENRDDLLGELTKNEQQLNALYTENQRLTKEHSDVSTQLHIVRASLEQVKTDNERLQHSLLIHDDEEKDFEKNIAALQSELDHSQNINIGLTSEISALEAKIEVLTSQSALNSPDYHLQEISQLDFEMQQLQSDHEAELKKLRIEINEVRETNVTLEEAVQDIQVEKEDLEVENEELASKLADLTTQAKMMLVRNEEMETQLSEVRMEYEDRLSELELMNKKLQCKNDEVLGASDSLVSDVVQNQEMAQKYEEALEMIQQLKSDMTSLQRQKLKNTDNISLSASEQDQLKYLQEENHELHAVVDHLTSENKAAMEIKFIVFELKAKNIELTESLRSASEQKKAAIDVIEHLKVHNEKLKEQISNLQNSASTKNSSAIIGHVSKQSSEDRVISYENGALQMRDISDEDALTELDYYKATVHQLMRDRSLFTQRLSELMDLNTQPLNHHHSNHGIHSPFDIKEARGMNNLLLESNDKAEIGKTSIDNESNCYAIASNKESSNIDVFEEQVKMLSYENGQLAHRLGGVVAEKEFAMTILSKIGAKMEELVQRNKYLESIFDLKSEYTAGVKSKKDFDLNSNTDDPSIVTSVSDVNLGKKELRMRQREPLGQNAYDLIPIDSRALLDTKQSLHHDPPSHEKEDLVSDVNYFSNQFSYPSISSKMESTIAAYSPSSHLKAESQSHQHDSFDGSRSEFVNSEYNNSMSLRLLSEPKLIRAPGREYFGQLNKNGQYHGRGKMRYDNGNEYEGEWAYNKRDGNGTTRYASGNLYVGSWKAGKRHGFGVFHIKKTGDVYKGHWECGFKSGPGVYEYADGELDVSVYCKDIRVGEGVRWSASRNKASRLVDGQLVGEEGEMSVEEALLLTQRLGFAV